MWRKGTRLTGNTRRTRARLEAVWGRGRVIVICPYGATSLPHFSSLYTRSTYGVEAVEDWIEGLCRMNHRIAMYSAL